MRWDLLAMAKIFTYKDNMVDLTKVAAIEIEDKQITFCMDGDWEFVIDVDDKDINNVKRGLVDQFNS